jgi:subtilisin-like proprotein convertase family protein
VSPAGTIRIDDAGSAREFVLALDEVVRRQADGTEETVKLTAQPDFAALRSTAGSLPRADGASISPVLYEIGAARNASTRRIVTAEVRVEIAPGADLPTTLPGVIEVDRPDYAPDFAVLRFDDSFAALDRVAAVRSWPGIVAADVLLARQQTRRALPNDPLVGQQWHLKNTGQSRGTVGADINVESVWNYPGTGYRGAGLVVGVVDDGLETTHPDLAANVRTDIDRDWNDSTPDDPSPGSDDDHGTSCAGNVAAIGNNNLGVVGSAPESKIVGLRLIAASTSDAQEAEAMAWRNDLIPIKSNSWGPTDDGRTLEAPGSLTRAALANAAATGRANRGTIILWAGGNGLQDNDNSNSDGYANSIYTIAIGASTNQNAQSYYGEPGANLVVVAPSSGGTLDVTTVDRSGSAGYNTASGAAGNYATDFGGTSSATPTVAGVVALMLQRNPALGWRDVQEILIRSAAKLRPADSDWITNPAGLHFNHKFGAGLVDAAAAVTAAATWTNLGPQTSAVSTQSNSTTIPDSNSTGITRTFDLGSSNLRVEHVTLRLNVNHTSRGNLAITLTSPSGVASRLAEVHSDTGDHYANWTFMTVRDWGENSRGTWTLQIADRSTAGNANGGTLTSATLTVFGTVSAPVNPKPIVQLTAPNDQAVFSPGAAIPLAANASDLTASGQPGAVTRVEFLVDGSVVGSDPTAPYSFAWTPPAIGTYTIQARATDSEGAVGSSGTRSITAANQPPTISAASVTPTGQGYSDEPLTVFDVAATDPEGATVSIDYEWQSSLDGVSFTTAPLRTVASISATPGRIWRCVLTPSDGVTVGEPFTTGATMILTRPPSSVLSGTAYDYTSDLVLRGTSASFSRAAIINEFSQGPSGGASEWVEILTLAPTSLRQWRFDDATVNNTAVTFLNATVWDPVPAGTIVVIYNSSSRDPKLPADDFDPTDGTLVIPSNRSTHFSGSWPALANGGDGLVIKDATGNAIHEISYGSNSTFSPRIGSVGSNIAAAFTGDTEAAAATASAWRTHSATTTGSPTVAGVTPGAGNTPANATFVDRLRSGDFDQAAVFRVAPGTSLPSGLTLDSATGRLAGAATAPTGNYPITIQRTNALGESVEQAFVLSVLPVTKTFAQWAASYPSLTDTSQGGDPDGDGHPNLLEYVQGSDPTLPETQPLLTGSHTATEVVLRFVQSRTITGVAVTGESSTNLIDWSADGVTFDPDQHAGPNLLRTARSPSKFLRLKISAAD